MAGRLALGFVPTMTLALRLAVAGTRALMLGSTLADTRGGAKRDSSADPSLFPMAYLGRKDFILEGVKVEIAKARFICQQVKILRREAAQNEPDVAIGHGRVVEILIF